MTPLARRVLESIGGGDGWVFTAGSITRFLATGRQISERRLLQYLKRLLKKLGLKGHLHTFRHAFISNALINGTPQAIVRQWVGHVDAEILKLYTHIADAAPQAAMQRLADANNTRNTDGEGEA
jgi:site-specific recombinase XerD